MKLLGSRSSNDPDSESNSDFHNSIFRQNYSEEDNTQLVRKGKVT